MLVGFQRLLVGHGTLDVMGFGVIKQNSFYPTTSTGKLLKSDTQDTNIKSNKNIQETFRLCEPDALIMPRKEIN